MLLDHLNCHKHTEKVFGLFCGGHCCVTDVPPWSLTLLASSATLAMLPVEARGQRAQGCLQAVFPSPACKGFARHLSNCDTSPERNPIFQWSAPQEYQGGRPWAPAPTLHLRKKVMSVYKSIFLTHCPPPKTLQARGPMSLSLLQCPGRGPHQP